ncbi:helix-turn-helix domain-containing protein [Amycolatopsis sp. WQ 127309]|uniref:helix-turn-helix domain-containing protein n=1 Tax=Amycolatopsis sp. WQ 127309 TaxID=2932773 RepID=UPI001FF4AF4A|nr:helix-turn-helix transcriptional regulator [Amycolatopsis sp. WQ 127309]UOZ10555.1 helix-turn-helix domain-containing protein [Amycolatopsis sp. WQ 127309]
MFATTEGEYENGARLRAAREYVKLSLADMAAATNYSKTYLSQIETGVRPLHLDVVSAYERVLGVGMRRKDITHPKLRKIEDEQHLARIKTAVESGDPDIFAEGPTSSTIDAAVAPIVNPAGVEHFRTWAVDGKTSTLRANAVSIVGFLPGRENADLVAHVLDTDERVRRLCLASEVSRLMQYDWTTSKQVAADPTTAPDPQKLAAKLAKEAVSKDSEARWCAGWLLQRLAPALAG